MAGYAAVVLAGGRASRLGGVDKPSLPVAGVPLLHRVLAAVADADPRIVVGPAGRRLPTGVRRTREEPAGAGPVAATAAGLALVPRGLEFVALLAADLPFLTREAVGRLRRAAAVAGCDGAVYEDGVGRPQWLCGIWRSEVLRTRLAELATGVAGASLRTLLTGVATTRLHHPGDGPDPPVWYDCDTEQDLLRAAEFAAAGGVGRNPGGGRAHVVSLPQGTPPGRWARRGPDGGAGVA